MNTTQVTSKYQTTIPENIRKHANIQAGEKVYWEIVKSLIVLRPAKKIKDPVGFLTGQIHTSLDAVKLVKEAREEFR